MARRLVETKSCTGVTFDNNQIRQACAQDRCGERVEDEIMASATCSAQLQAIVITG